MKKIINILLSMGVLLMALSCVETNGLDEVPKGEICMSPVLSDMAVTRGDATSNTTPYPDGQSFGAFAYYSQAEAGEPWTGKIETYFENHEFKSESGQCTGTPPAYWPFSGSLIFAGYSPYDKDADVDFDTSTKTLIIKNYEVGDTDLAYFLPTLSEGNYIGYDKKTASVPVEFHHALSLLSFSISANEEDKNNIKLKSVTLKGVVTKGNVSASETSGVTWEPTSTENVLLFSSDGSGESLLSSKNYKYFVVPGAPYKMEIAYEDGILENGIDEKSYSLDLSDHTDGDWVMGKKYVYGITLSVDLKPIVLSPTASIKPVYQDGVLSGSKVIVNFANLGEDAKKRIKELTVKVSRNGTTYKEQSFDAIEDELVVIDGGKLYLPSNNGTNEYRIDCIYNDGRGEKTSTVYAKALAPQFDCTFNIITGIKSVTAVSAGVSISDGVLQEVKLTRVLIKLTKDNTQEQLYNATDVGVSNILINNFKSGLSSGIWQTTQTGVVFDGVQLMKNGIEYKVPSSYKRSSSKINNVSLLEDGAKYMICQHNTSTYWCYYNNKLSTKTNIADFNNITSDETIFVYKKSDMASQASSNYSYSSVCALVSAYSCEYLKYNFEFGDDPQYFTLTNGWRSNPSSSPTPSEDVDIYQYDCVNNYMINYRNSSFKWGNDGTAYYKWNIYKVEEVY